MWMLFKRRVRKGAMMRIVLRFVVVILLMSVAMFADVISIVGPVSNPIVGDTFNVDVDVTGITDLFAFQFDLTFDPTLLSAVSVIEGPFLPGGGTTIFIPGSIDNVGGTVAATADTLIGAISGVAGNGVLAEFQFTALAPGTSALSFGNEILLDSSLSDITACRLYRSRAAWFWFALRFRFLL
jgi:Cohesin domain